MPLYRAELLAKKPLRYAALIHDVSQVLYLPFDYDDGSYARDRSGYNNSGTIYGAARTSGKIGMAIRTDGVDDYVEVPHSPSLDLSEFTVMAWYKLETLPSAKGVWAQPVEKHDYATRGWAIGVDYGDDHIKPHVGDGSAWHFCDSGVKVVTGVWYHEAATYDGTLKSYVNGEFKNSITVGFVKSPNPIWMGRLHDWPDQVMDGIIGEVRVYNRALSQDEIRMLMYRRLV